MKLRVIIIYQDDITIQCNNVRMKYNAVTGLKLNADEFEDFVLGPSNVDLYYHDEEDDLDEIDDIVKIRDPTPFLSPLIEMRDYFIATNEFEMKKQMDNALNCIQGHLDAFK